MLVVHKFIIFFLFDTEFFTAIILKWNQATSMSSIAIQESCYSW